MGKHFNRSAITKRISCYCTLARPKHWLKNIFVLAPLVFAGRLTHLPALTGALWAFASFCLASSAIYVVNDIQDIDADRNHPRKMHRPLPSAQIGITQAWIWAAALALLSMGASIAIYRQYGYRFEAVLLAYILLNVSYSLWLKHVELVDAFCIATGFVLRVIGGAYAINVEPTGWIIVTTFFLCLFLGFGKRRNEILLLRDGSVDHRSVLKNYKISLLDQMMVSTGTIAVISYALYTLDRSVIGKFGSDNLYYTVLFVAYGVFRYMYLLIEGKEGDPTEIVTSDWSLIVNALLWLATAYLTISLNGGHLR
jgi:4-hydroxybenzoate polyprenyltransferase